MSAPAKGIQAPHHLPNRFSQRLVAWQAEHGRHDMPWQTDRTPYRVWLSEVMLQQTQVESAKGHYLRFLQAFPSVQDLARASIDDVLAQWSGLGYYSRARNLHACAQWVVNTNRGVFPSSSKELAQLPGIGPSTAAAIASFCFSERTSIFDGNVQRVTSRLSGFGEDLAKAGAKRTLQAIAQAALGTDDAPGDAAVSMVGHTQGLMDLGATVCTPRKPRCDACPFASDCVAHAQGLETALPVMTKKLVKKVLHSQWVCLWNEDALAMSRRPDTGIWSGLWTPLELPMERVDEFKAWLLAQGLSFDEQPRMKHVLTHRDWFIDILHVECTPLKARGELDLCLSHWWSIGAQSPTGECPMGASSMRWIRKSNMHAWGTPGPLQAVLEHENKFS
jgi:A/G-specific adenine glycosylase